MAGRLHPDRLLMQRVHQGDAAAMEEILRRFGPKLRQLTGRLTGWHPDHEDVMQEVLLGIWQRSGHYLGEGPLEAWLVTTAVNICRNQQRAGRAFARLLRRYALLMNKPAANPKDGEQRVDELRSALQRLRESDRTVLVLYYLEEMSYSRIMEILRISQPALHARLHRARRRLHALLETRPPPVRGVSTAAGGPAELSRADRSLTENREKQDDSYG